MKPKISFEKIPDISTYLGKIVSIKPIQANRDIIQKLLVEGADRKALVKIYPNSSYIPEELEFLEFLEESSFPSQRIICNGFSTDYERRPFVAYSYEPGENKRVFSNSDIERTTNLTSRLHIKSKEYDFIFKKNRSTSWNLTHGDLHLENIIFSKEDAPYLIDFDHLTRRSFLEDVAEISFYMGLFDLTRNQGIFTESEVKSRVALIIDTYFKDNPIPYKSDFISFFNKKIRSFAKYSNKEFRKGEIKLGQLMNRTKAFNAMIGWSF